ncbi:MAG: hypothetical protein GKR94_09455 [Gammaproteobacteria bacterium]|nr:hypothetical protein [Gammaproteobacteria bacterium]
MPIERSANTTRILRARIEATPSPALSCPANTGSAGCSTIAVENGFLGAMAPVAPWGYRLVGEALEMRPSTPSTSAIAPQPPAHCANRGRRGPVRV